MSLTPDPSRKIGTGITPSPSPFLTPRLERRRTDPRLAEWNPSRLDRDKEVNVQVLLRCRPLSDEEQKLNVPKVISCSEHKREVTVTQNVASKQVDRTFTFDKVFGPKAQQRTIFDQAISPIVNEVLEGFNCTVFAYGQTGTGKTYTMEGGMRTKGGDLPAEAGVIPRAVRHIFDTLEAQNADYSMKVTFLELYNEEITDLLAPEEQTRLGDDKQKKPISLMEDGRGCVVVRGLEEEAVYSASDIYSLLERGAAKRRTADTLLNKRSSRSHSVFSITIHVKEAVVGEEELIKCGKLNLVDLAGSENISRSGAREGRAREAGEINKSLLTLGRVINALVEHSAHIPYRDSKLTRLLRDSLGGKTKTCIIATISPSAYSLDETLSTLDYAYRAKNIKNRPEANQKMSKAVLLKDLYLEIERMKEDVRAARDKNGVYVPHERYAQEEAEKKARIEKIEQLENDLNLSEKEVDRLNEQYLTVQEQNLNLESDLSDCKMNLEKSNKALLLLQENHKAAILTLKEKEIFISKLLSSENSLIERAKELRVDLQNASDDISSLFAALDNKEKMEVENRSQVLRFGSHLDHRLRELHKTIIGSVSQQQQQLRCMEEHAASFLASKSDATQALESRIKNMTTAYASGATTLKEVAQKMESKACSDLGLINSKVSSQLMAVEQFLGSMASEAKDVIEDIQHSLNDQKELLAFTAQQHQERLHRSLFSAQEISKATMEFLTDIQNHAFKFVTLLEESHKKRSQRLDDYEKVFKEDAAREEKQALDKIAAILTSMTLKKTALVSEASMHIKESDMQENSALQHQMSNMQQVSTDALEEVNKYVKKVQSHYMEDTFSADESRCMMDDCRQECSNKVNHSKKLWQDTESSINGLTRGSMAEIESNIRETTDKNRTLHKEFQSAVSSLDADLGAMTSDIMAAINDSLMRDRGNKKELDSLTASCLEQLKSVQANHGESISSIRSEAEKCLITDYLVDRQPTPKKRDVAVPSLASIEEMRTPSKEANPTEIGSKLSLTESKVQQLVASLALTPSRTPFADVN